MGECGCVCGYARMRVLARVLAYVRACMDESVGTCEDWYVCFLGCVCACVRACVGVCFHVCG